MDEKAVRALLERLAETEQPPSRVNIALALRGAQEAALAPRGSAWGSSPGGGRRSRNRRRLRYLRAWRPQRWRHLASWTALGVSQDVIPRTDRRHRAACPAC
jgi:hypothetical protein